MKSLLLSLTILISFTTLAQPPAYVPTNGLVGWWPFNANANDETGNGHNGTVNGATLTTDRFGTANAAYDFDGMDDYISVNDGLNLDGVNEMTLSVWVNFDNCSPGSGSGANLIPIISKWGQSGLEPNSSYLLYLTDAFMGYGIDCNQNIANYGLYFTNSTNNFTVQTWNHIVAQNNLSGFMLYINGDLVDTTIVANEGISDNNTALLFGDWYNQINSSYSTLDGILDDIGIWNRVLTQCEIQDLYNASVGSFSTVTQTGATLTADQTGATYQWLDCDNNYAVIAAETNQSYTPSNVTGNYAVEVTLNGCVDTSACYHVDFTGIEEPTNTKKELIKIIDFMGRETEFKPNTPLIFIYSDGTRERVMEIEE